MNAFIECIQVNEFIPALHYAYIRLIPLGFAVYELIEYWHNSVVKSATETPKHFDCHVISGLNVPGRSCFIFLCEFTELAVKLASLAVFRLSLARVCLFSLVFA